MALPGVHHHAAGQTGGRSSYSALSLFAGGALAIYGLRRNDWPGAVLAMLGGGLLYSGSQGTAHFRHSKAAVIPAREGIRVDETVVVDRPVALVYRFWRRLENLPAFMAHLVEVRQTGELTSHWIARGPAGIAVEWDAEIINEEENTLLAWKSLGHADVENAGSVHFTPVNNGEFTRVHVELKYNPPAGKLGAAVAKLFGEEPRQQVREDLVRFKELIEAEEFSDDELAVLKKYSNPQPLVPPASTSKLTEMVDEASEESFPASDAPNWRSRTH